MPGKSAARRDFLRKVVEVAAFSPTSLAIVGPPGAGKNEVAALASQLAESDYQGSTSDGRKIARHQVDRGARLLHLDEVPLADQDELGASGQVFSTSRVDPRTLIADGTLRPGFVARFATEVVRMPTRDERAVDIVPTAQEILKRLRVKQAAEFRARADFRQDQATPFEGDPPEISPALRAFLATRRYPGGVRELATLVQQILVNHAGDGPLTVGDLPREVLEAEHPPAKDEVP
jgi:DNA-binding NtrC family response regulator